MGEVTLQMSCRITDSYFIRKVQLPFLPPVGTAVEIRFDGIAAMEQNVEGINLLQDLTFVVTLQEWSGCDFTEGQARRFLTAANWVED